MACANKAGEQGGTAVEKGGRNGMMVRGLDRMAEQSQSHLEVFSALFSRPVLPPLIFRLHNPS